MKVILNTNQFNFAKHFYYWTNSLRYPVLLYSKSRYLCTIISQFNKTFSCLTSVSWVTKINRKVNRRVATKCQKIKCHSLYELETLFVVVCQTKDMKMSKIRSYVQRNSGRTSLRGPLLLFTATLSTNESTRLYFLNNWSNNNTKF